MNIAPENGRPVSGMTSAARHTAGPWKVYGHATRPGSIVDQRGEQIAAALTDAVQSEGERQANAELIAEAGTVAQETGLTPRQLAERCKELVKASAPLAEMLDGFPIGLPDQFEIMVKIDATPLGQVNAKLDRITDAVAAAKHELATSPVAAVRELSREPIGASA